jgi:integrase
VNPCRPHQPESAPSSAAVIDALDNPLLAANKELRHGAMARLQDLANAGYKPILLEWKQRWTEVFTKRHDRYPDAPHPPHDWVFFNPKNHDERATTFFCCFYQARKKAGLPKMTSHTLRHYFISRCIMSEIDMFTISRWTGHSSTRMIEQVYGHLTPTFRKVQMAKLVVTGAVSAPQSVAIPAAQSA